MSFQESILHHIPAEDDMGRRYRLAATMLAEQETAVLYETYIHAMDTVYGKSASVETRRAARIVIEALPAVLLGRAEALDHHIERLLDMMALDIGEGEEPIFYDATKGWTTLLDPDPEDVPGDDDLALDVWAGDEVVHLSMRVVREDGVRLTGSLPAEFVGDLIQALNLAREDALSTEGESHPDE